VISRRARIAVRWSLLFAALAAASLAMLAWYGVRLADGAMRGDAGGSDATVLSGPLVLRRGDPWSEAELVRSLAARGLVQVAAAPRAGEFTAAGGRVTVGPGRAEGTGEGISLLATPRGLEVETASGLQLTEAVLVPAAIGFGGGDGQTRLDVPLEGMAPWLLTAVVDIEDRTFLSHPGLSARGLVRAAVADLVAGGVRQGGSTITQQLAKILMLRPSRTIARKVLEAWLAALLEYRYDKRTILETYLNRIYLGQDRGLELHGVGIASRYYFGKGPGELREEEAALLAGLIAAPNRFDPFAHPGEARSRRRIVLEAMARQGHLTGAAAARLAEAPLPAAPRRLQWPPAAQAVEAALAAAAGGDAPVVTTLDVDFQQAAVDGVRAGLAALEARHAGLRRLAEAGDPVQAAVVAVAPDGRMLALVGSRRAGPGEFNRALAARRQVGSLVKPFVVAEALAAGRSLDDPLLDEPLTVAAAGRPWRPENSDGRYRGSVTIRRALVESLNVPMVRLGLDLGVGRVAAALARLGLGAGDGPPAILLGAVEATPLEVARAFAALAAGGRPPRVALLAGDAAPGTAPALDPGACAAVVEALRDVVRHGTAAALGPTYGGRLAAKTGTTDDRRDSWFVALRNRVVTVVWLGTDANRETGLYGATGAMEVWRAVDQRLPGSWRR